MIPEPKSGQRKGARPPEKDDGTVIAARILELAREAGFDLVAVRSAVPAYTAGHYGLWLDNGFHGTMGYLAREDSVHRRSDPAFVLPSVRTVVTVGLNYQTASLPPQVRDDPARGVIASYALGQDYHDVLLPRLQAMAETIEHLVPDPVVSRAYVDTGPLLERELAAVAGLGFIGKNTNLINRRMGSWILLGELLLTIDTGLPRHPPARQLAPNTARPSAKSREQTGPPNGGLDALHRLGTCGQCTRCLDTCPTGALIAPYILDARRCISYLTIENKGAIPRELRPLIGNRIFGCDICQEVCPWNRRFATATAELALQPRVGTMAPALLDLFSLDEQTFDRRFGGSAVKRTKRRGLARNVAVALGNWGHPQAVPALLAALRDPEPLVRGHAAWALIRIATGQTELRETIASALHEAQATEPDLWVLGELKGAGA